MWYKVRFGDKNDDQQYNVEANSPFEAEEKWKKTLYNNGRNRIFSVSEL